MYNLSHMTSSKIIRITVPGNVFSPVKFIFIGNGLSEIIKKRRPVTFSGSGDRISALRMSRNWSEEGSESRQLGAVCSEKSFCLMTGNIASCHDDAELS